MHHLEIMEQDGVLWVPAPTLLAGIGLNSISLSDSAAILLMRLQTNDDC